MKCDNCGDEVKEYVKIESGEIYCPICNRAYLYGWQARDEQIFGFNEDDEIMENDPIFIAYKESTNN